MAGSASTSAPSGTKRWSNIQKLLKVLIYFLGIGFAFRAVRLSTVAQVPSASARTCTKDPELSVRDDEWLKNATGMVLLPFN